MVNQKELLKILNEERDYEDKIADDLFNYINYSLKEMNTISDKERDAVKKTISMIANESLKHRQMFTKLIERCLSDEEIS